MKHIQTLSILLLFLPVLANAQQCDIKNLVFEGAGIRGIAYAGVIDELEQQGRLAGVEKVGGTSAGAITALMLSLDYTSTEIGDIIASTEFRKFNDGRFMFIGGIARMTRQYGWYRGERFTDWIAALIKNKTGSTETTFEELSRSGHKDLYITATCLNRQELLVFSRENYPNMKLKDAVRISMSIPLYFRAVFIDSTGTVYKKPGKTSGLDIVVDGGITGNFPIFMFDSTATDAEKKAQRIPDFHTLGVRIDSDQQIENDAATRELVPLEIRDLNDYMSALYIYIIENLNRNELTDDDWARTVSVSSVGITPRIKKLSKEQKDMLIQSGKEFTASYLQNRCTATGKAAN